MYFRVITLELVDSPSFYDLIYVRIETTGWKVFYKMTELNEEETSGSQKRQILQ